MAVVVEISFKRVKQSFLVVLALMSLWVGTTRWIRADVDRTGPRTVRVDLHFILPIREDGLRNSISMDDWPEEYGNLKPNLTLQAKGPFLATVTIDEKRRARGIPFTLRIRDLPTKTLFPTITGRVRVDKAVPPRLLTGDLKDQPTKGPVLLEFDSPIRPKTLGPRGVQGLRGTLVSSDSGIGMKWYYYPSPPLKHGIPMTLRFTQGVKGSGGSSLRPKSITLTGAPKLECGYVSPKPGQGKVWLTRTIRMDFNQPLKDGRILVTGLPGRTEMDGSSLIYRPEHSLLPGTEYRVTALGVSDMGERTRVAYSFRTTDIGPLVWADIRLMDGGKALITLWHGKDPFPGSHGFECKGKQDRIRLSLPEATLYVSDERADLLKLNADVVLHQDGATGLPPYSGSISINADAYAMLRKSLKKGSMVILHR